MNRRYPKRGSFRLSAFVSIALGLTIVLGGAPTVFAQDATPEHEGAGWAG